MISVEGHGRSWQILQVYTDQQRLLQFEMGRLEMEQTRTNIGLRPDTRSNPKLDITIYLHIAINPAPDDVHELLLRNRTRVNLHRDLTPKTYSRDQIFKIRRVYKITKRPPLIRQAFSAYKPVEIYLFNACSAKNWSLVIKDFVVDENIDVLVVTETWLQTDISVTDICPTGFAIHHLHSRGGGLALLCKDQFKLKKTVPEYFI